MTTKIQKITSLEGQIVKVTPQASLQTDSKAKYSVMQHSSGTSLVEKIKNFFRSILDFLKCIFCCQCPKKKQEENQGSSTTKAESTKTASIKQSSEGSTVTIQAGSTQTASIKQASEDKKSSRTDADDKKKKPDSETKPDPKDPKSLEKRVEVLSATSTSSKSAAPQALQDSQSRDKSKEKEQSKGKTPADIFKTTFPDKSNSSAKAPSQPQQPPLQTQTTQVAPAKKPVSATTTPSAPPIQQLPPPPPPPPVIHPPQPRQPRQNRNAGLALRTPQPTQTLTTTLPPVPQVRRQHHVQRYRLGAGRGGAPGGSSSPEFLALCKQFEEKFAATLARRKQIAESIPSIHIPGILDIINGYASDESHFEATPPPKVPDDVQDINHRLSSRFHITQNGAAVEISLQISEDQSRKQVRGPSPDIIFILDRSGSMGNNGGEATLREAFAPLFQKGQTTEETLIPEDSRVGIYTFDDQAEVPFPLALIDEPTSDGSPTLREKLIAAFKDRSANSIIKARGNTEVLTSLMDALCKLAEAGAFNQSTANAIRPLEIVICTDGGNGTPIAERLISNMMEVIWKVLPDVAENIHIRVVGMGNGIRYDQLRALARGTGEVATVQMGKPEQLRAVIESVLKDRGVLLNNVKVTLIAPPGCTIKRVRGYEIPERSNTVTLPIASFADGDLSRLFVELEGPVGNGQMQVKIEGYDQIARRRYEPRLETISFRGAQDPRASEMIRQQDQYRQTLENILKEQDKAKKLKLAEEMLTKLDVYYLPWMINLMQICSELTYQADDAVNAETVKKMIETELDKLNKIGKSKRSGPCMATIEILEKLQARGLLRLVTRDHVTEVFSNEPATQDFWRLSSYDDHHLVLCWPDKANPQGAPKEQLFKVERTESKEPRILLDNELSATKQDVAFTFDELLDEKEDIKESHETGKALNKAKKKEEKKETN